MTVFVSHTVGGERLPFPVPVPPTPERAAWQALAASYRASLVAAGEEVREIVRPEIYQAPIAWKVLGAKPGDWHLAVKPLVQVRPFHGLRNVAVLADFPGASGPAEGLPLTPLDVLARIDAVICLSRGTAEKLSGEGVPRVFLLPPDVEGFASGLARLRAVLL